MIKKNVYSVKSVCVDSVISCVLAGISFFSQITAVIMSYIYAGKGPKAVGILGLAGFWMAVTGMVFCKSAWKSPDGGVFMKRICGIINTVLILCSIILYILGWI